MTSILFRDLPGVAEIERQLDLQLRDRLLDDEQEELPSLIDDTSRSLFNITEHDTHYSALPDSVRARFTRDQWAAEFDALGEYRRDPNAIWQSFGLDVRCPEGRGLHCLDVFGRQLIAAVNGLHPQAMLVFAEYPEARAA
jgi:hypothetical protein